MKIAPIPPYERARLDELLRLEVLDSDAEQCLDELTELASTICNVPISLISLVDSDRQWFKSRVGLDATQTHRDIAFCSHAILQEGIFEISDTHTDPRFHDNPLVTGDPNIAFYAGAPLTTPRGLAIGTLCVIDSQPKTLTDDQKQALRVLANQVISQLELRLHNRQLVRMQQEQEAFFALMAHDLRSPFNSILGLSKILKRKANHLTPERLTTLASGILSSSLTVYQLLDELLQWARDNIGATHIHRSEANLPDVILETCDFLEEAFSLKNLSVHMALDPATSIRIDVSITKTILRNLLSNAIKYSPQNGGITISLHEIEGAYVIAVSDEGDGVDHDIKCALFDQCVSSHIGTHGELGEGLGLKLSAQFAKKQGGKLWIDETYTQGAKFVFSIPFVTDDDM